MKKINRKQIEKYLPKIQNLVRENPAWAGSLAELRKIDEIRRFRDEPITEEEFNELVLRIPYSDIVLYRQHGLDFPRTGELDEKIE